MKYNYIEDIQDQFRFLKRNNYVSKGTYEIQAASFIADKSSIFGESNKDYIKAEIDWYKSQSLNVNDIKKHYGSVPKIWQMVSSEEGLINSNYGWCIFSGDNGNQYEKCRDALRDNRDTRHGVMYYTRPTMHEDASCCGMSDHMCTFSVQYHINPGDRIDAHVYMRSNDAIYGYNNDVAWQKYVLHTSNFGDLSMKPGNIHWHASSLHIYERHWDLIV